MEVDMQMDKKDVIFVPSLYCGMAYSVLVVDANSVIEQELKI